MLPIKQLRRDCWEMLHNASVYEPLLGTPGIFDGLPFYFDGARLLFIGYEIARSRRSIGQRMTAFLRCRNDIAERLETLEYWGPRCPDINMDGLMCVKTAAPDPTNCDVILDLRQVTPDRLRSERFVRRAVARGVVARQSADKVTGVEHERLVVSFLHRHSDLDADDLEYLNNWKCILDRSDSELFEVRRGGYLSGFVILSLFADSMATYAYGFFDNAIAGSSDAAYCAMIVYCQDMGYLKLDLGYSINASLLRYKKKWGHTTLLPAPWSVTWRWDQARDCREGRTSPAEIDVAV